MAHIGVVIPYFQRDAGILAKALTSVAVQTIPGHTLTVVVVDDSSPRPADLDIATLDAAFRREIVVLKQDNGGPGAARNTALSYLKDTSIDFVALLDSDDVWLPDHLANAVAMLGDDNDYYFADHRRDGHFRDKLSYFEENPLIREWLDDLDSGPIERGSAPGLFLLRKDWGILPFMLDYLSHASTVVYRFGRLKHVRFKPELRIAGEDILFWLCLAREARRVCFSLHVEVLCETGVSIYYSTLSWDHPDSPTRFAYQWLAWRYVADEFALTAAEARTVRDKIAGFARGFSYIWLRTVIRTRQANMPLLAFLSSKGWRLWWIPGHVAQVAARKLLRKPLFIES